LNVNIPDVALGELKGIRWTRAGYREYREVVKEALDPRGQPYYWIAGDRAHQPDQPGTDISAVDAGYVSVTPISYDMTSRGDLERLAAWLKERSGDSGSQRGRDG
jgi:5'-nucleotidase